MNLDKNTKFPISLYYIFSVNISVKIYPKQLLPGNYILWTSKNYTYGNFWKIRWLQIWKIIFQVSILVLINILQYSLISKNRYISIFKNIKKKLQITIFHIYFTRSCGWFFNLDFGKIATLKLKWFIFRHD